LEEKEGSRPRCWVDKSILDKDGRQKYGGFLKKRGQMFEF
jgi:hypothetical protein